MVVASFRRICFCLLIRLLALCLLLLGLAMPAEAVVTLVSFTASASDGGVILEWKTGTEFDNAGFYLHRSTAETGEYIPISSFIPSEGDGVIGAEYSYLDQDVQSGTTYYYKLESVDMDGSSEFHGSVSATTSLSATATPTRSPTPTPSSTPSLTPTATKMHTPPPEAPTPTATPTPSPTKTSTPGATITPTFTRQPTPTSPLTSLPSPMPTATPTSTSTPPHTPTLLPTTTPTNTPTAKRQIPPLTPTPIPHLLIPTPTLTPIRCAGPTSALPLPTPLPSTATPTPPPHHPATRSISLVLRLAPPLGVALLSALVWRVWRQGHPGGDKR
ncbi:MAG: hypothetical protein U9Q78_05670 [Chloroflexota bacterium]|nr:hypothetical protein [Chloroflexota bacterium]